MKNTRNKYAFGILLKEIMDKYSIHINDFTKEYYFNSSTVRHWRSGNRLPQKHQQTKNSPNEITINLIITKLLEIAPTEKDIYLDNSLKNQLKYYIKKFNYYELPKMARDQILNEENINLFIEYILRRSYEHKLVFKQNMPFFEVKKNSTNSDPKIIVFDFDGTLTKSNEMRTTWESIWTSLEYDIENCQELHKQFSQNKITHQEWCDLTQEKFTQKKLHKNTLIEIAKRIQLIKGFEETIKYLKNKDIKLYILSGSIEDVILEVLGEYSKYFDDISANKFIFDKNNILEKIIGTKYDFEGKADYLYKLANESKIPTNEILFIGNSFNDHFAKSSGVRTLCINPNKTHYHPSYWDEYIETVTNLTKINSFIFVNNNDL